MNKNRNILKKLQGMSQWIWFDGADLERNKIAKEAYKEIFSLYHQLADANHEINSLKRKIRKSHQI
jgi:hypothetical protein